MNDDQPETPNSLPGLTIDQHVGKRLQIARQAHGLSTTTLGRALEVPVATVTRWEDGSWRIPAHYLLELSQLLSFPLTAFFDDFPLAESLKEELDRSESYVNAMFDRHSDAKH